MSTKHLRFIPQLDSFRCFAVMFVLMSHWVPRSNSFLPNGCLGVTFFFVLSGYLITSNLIYLKKSIDEQQLSMGNAFRIFYIRRTLRIFPLYFMVIFLLYAGNRNIFEGNVAWYLGYVPNFLFFKQKAWPGMLSHFWSLGVEEQFYLVWPLLIFVIRWKWLKYVFPGIVLLSVGVKLCMFSFSHSFFTINDVLPIYTFDAFGMGAVLAIIPFEGAKWLKKLDAIPFNAGFFISVTLSVLVYKLKLSFLFSLTVSSASYFLIRQARTGFKGLAGAVLNNGIFRYLGKISYGLYVYHNFMPWLWRCLTGRETANPLPIPSIHYSPLNGPYVSFVIQLGLLVIIASISWFLVEKPLNDLKRWVGNKGMEPAKATSIILSKHD